MTRKRRDLSNSTPSSYFCDGNGEGEGLFLSNGERPNPFPEHKLLNGEVELNNSKKKMMRLTFRKPIQTTAIV